jgi:hypothetical protein
MCISGQNHSLVVDSPALGGGGRDKSGSSNREYRIHPHKEALTANLQQNRLIWILGSVESRSGAMVTIRAGSSRKSSDGHEGNESGDGGPVNLSACIIPLVKRLHLCKRW